MPNQPPVWEKIVAWYPGPVYENRLMINNAFVQPDIPQLNMAMFAPLTVDSMTVDQALDECNVVMKTQILIANMEQSTKLSHVVFSIAVGALTVEFEARQLKVTIVGRPTSQPPIQLDIANVEVAPLVDFITMEQNFKLTITQPTNGKIQGSGFDCGTAVCEQWFDEGEVVHLNAVPDSGYHFKEWTGDIGADGSVLMNKNKSGSCIFEAD